MIKTLQLGGLGLSKKGALDTLADIAMVVRTETWRETVVADGTAQSQATDWSGNANHLVQASGTLQPVYKVALINGKPAWRSDGTDDYLMSASIAAMNNTDVRWYYCVYSIRTNSQEAVFSGDNTGHSTAQDLLLHRIAPDGDLVRFSWGTTSFDDKTGSTSSTNLWRMASMVADGTNIVRKIGPALLNNSIAQTSGPVSGTYKLMMAANNQAAPANQGAVDVAALFCGNTVLTSGQKGRIEAYLSRIFGLAP